MHQIFNRYELISLALVNESDTNVFINITSNKTRLKIDDDITCYS